MRGPLHGIGSHWDEWFRHEASADDRRAIEHTGQSKPAQRRFVSWLVRHWARETNWRGRRPPVRFVLRQLALVAPFDRWPTLEKYRSTYGVAGVSAVVLAEQSRGEAQDVRRVEAVALPLDADGAASAMVPEGFQADSDTLTSARRAALSLLGGKGLLVFVVLWILGGRRPYPVWLRVGVGLGWLAVGALIVRLVTGPEPGEYLTTLGAVLLALWAGLALAAIAIAATLSLQAWRAGRGWRAQLQESQVRLRMDGGLRVQGGSAGLAFLLDTLGSLDRANPIPARRSWLWRQFLRRLRSEGVSWAATGVVTPTGRVEPVVLEPKIRACLQRPEIEQVLTPRQREGRQRMIDRLTRAEALPGREPARRAAGAIRLGFASEQGRLRGYQCRHGAQAVMAVGRLTSRWQMVMTALAFAVSGVMLVALPDVRDIVRPPLPPAVVGPSSPSPYHLWVSLDTKNPESFYVVLESGFWANRRSTVARYGGANASVRAELRLNRVAQPLAQSEEDGTVWIERRRRFLGRDFAPGDRVGRYSFSYVTRLGGLDAPRSRGANRE